MYVEGDALDAGWREEALPKNLSISKKRFLWIK